MSHQKISTQIEVLEENYQSLVRALQESEQKYRSVVENIKQIIFQTDAAGLWSFLNSAWTEITGFTVEESLGANFLDYVHPEDRQRNLELFGPLIERKKDYCRHEVRYLTKEGGYCWVEVFARLTLDSNGNTIGTSGTLTDITQRKKMEKELKQYQENLEEMVKERTLALERSNEQLNKYQILAKNAKEIMIFTKTDGRIIEVNEAARGAYGYEREELLTMNIHDLSGEGSPQQTLEQIKRAISQGILFETRHRRKDGTLFPVEVSAQGTNVGKEQLILSIARDITERKNSEKQLKFFATHDFLTSVPNRYYLEEYLSQIMKEICDGCKGALLFIDIDNFKVVNDSFGHAAGDKLLIQVAKKLRKTIRQGDFLARLGGDEFAVVLRGVGLDGAKVVAGKLINELRNSQFAIDEKGHSFNVTVSVGITLICDSINTQETLAYADVALYNAKEEGKNRFVSIQTSEEKIKLSEMNMTVRLINECLRENRFILHYQPVFKKDKGVLHYEALLRMIDDDGKMIYPASFLSIAERFGLMSQIDQWVIKSAIGTLCQRPEISMFINISPTSLGDEELLRFVESTIKLSGVNPERIAFEITETAAVRDLVQAEAWINHLKKIGCKFALDDFGVGFTSFTYLQRLSVDYLKIDGSFVKNLDTDYTQRALVQAMNGVAHTLGKVTIAEFVENEAIWQILHDLGVDLGQGYFLGRPTSIDNVDKK